MRIPPGLPLALALALVLVAAAAAQQRIGEVSTTFRLIGPNDKIVVERFDDPKVENVSCYLSRAETGGMSGLVGLAEDPARFSIACRATGRPRIAGPIDRSDDGEIVFDQRTSALFKELRVSRFLDAQKRVLVYLVWSTKTLSTDGSPFNSVTAVPLD
ncbi:MAG: CreA family protein [Alphaproteobacteria bacterium]|nr:CreA family protein [Alphaproteobacteria bacterium]